MHHVFSRLLKKVVARYHFIFCSVIVDKAKICLFTLTRSAEKMNTVRLNHCFVTIVILRCVSVPVTSMQILVSDNIGENVSNSTPKDAPIFYTNRGVNFRCVARGGYPEPEVRVLIGSRRIGSLYNMPSSVQTKRLPRRYQYSKLYCLVTCFFLSSIVFFHPIFCIEYNIYFEYNVMNERMNE